jgi:hypothetical protein
VRHNGGRRGWDKAAARARCHRHVVARSSEIDGRAARASWQGRDTGCGKSPAADPVGGRLGRIGGHALARLAGVGIIDEVAGGRCPSTG